MLRLTIRLSQLREIRQAFERSPQVISTILHAAMVESTTIAQEEIQDSAPVNTGRLQSSIKRRTDKSWTAGERGVVWVDKVPYALFVEFGTVSHDIVPVTAKALRFEVAGKVVFAKKVHHPGTSADPFFETGAELAEPQIEATFADALDEVTRHLAHQA